MKRNYSLDFMKLLFAYVVALFHLEVIGGIYADVAVQVFFVISGYFLGRKFYSRSHGDPQKAYGPWQYTWDRIRGIYPAYVLALVFFLGYVLARSALSFVQSPGWEGLWAMVCTVYDQLPDLLMLQSSYQYAQNLNCPTWQISALVIAGYFVYALLCRDEKQACTIVFPAAVLMLTCLLETGVDLFGRFGPIYMPLLRAFGPLGLGVLVYRFHESEYFAQLKNHRILFNGLSLLSVPAILIFKDRGMLHLVWAALMILGCMEPDSLLNRLLDRKAFASFGTLSLGVYLNHALMLRFFRAVLMPFVQGRGIVLGDVIWSGVYLAAVIAFAVFSDWLLKCLRRRKNSVTA